MVIGRVIKNHDNVRFVFRPLPLIGVMDKSDKAVIAALAADEQGKFWNMYDLLFVKHEEWAGLPAAEFNAWVVREGMAAGMDGEKLQAAIEYSQDHDQNDVDV